MGKSRSQISQALVALLNASGALGSNTSAFEATSGAAGAAVENFLASELTFPIAAVETLDAKPDPEVQGRWDEARFKIGVVGTAVTEVPVSSNLASGGTASSQHSAENTIRTALAALNPGPAFAFTDTLHGFQGEVESVSAERLVTRQGKVWSIAEVVVVAYNATRADT